MSETGWGEFTVQIRLQFIPESSEKPITIPHPIKLHHWGAPIEGVPPANTAVAPSAPVTAASTPAAAAGAGPSESTPAPPSEIAPAETPGQTSETKDTDGDVKMEVDTPATADAEGEAEEGGSITAIRPEPPMPAPPLISVANKLPVHAWQYDELVFSDPPLAFYNILCDHPPTPLPAKNRRARDQREDQAKRKKGRVSTLAAKSNSRAATPSGDLTSSVPPATVVPAAGVSVGVGIPGEPGSADVPLEFTSEMEKGEWNRLHDAKKKIIEEMDRWR